MDVLKLSAVETALESVEDRCRRAAWWGTILAAAAITAAAGGCTFGGGGAHPPALTGARPVTAARPIRLAAPTAAATPPAGSGSGHCSTIEAILSSSIGGSCGSRLVSSEERTHEMSQERMPSRLRKSLLGTRLQGLAPRRSRAAITRARPAPWEYDPAAMRQQPKEIQFITATMVVFGHK
jgi:hypothetical protein